MSGRAGIVYRASGAAGAWMGPFSDSDALYPPANARGRRFWGRVGSGLSNEGLVSKILVAGEVQFGGGSPMHGLATTTNGDPVTSRASVGLFHGLGWREREGEPA
jgi:hypothetical protein